MKILRNTSCCILLSLMFVFNGCRQKTDNIEVTEQRETVTKLTDTIVENPKVLIRYNEPINDYIVKVDWFPSKGADGVGQAIMEFTHSTRKTVFYIFNEYFSDPYLIDLVNDFSYVFRDGESFLLNYTPPQKDELIGHNTPFQFLDVDFDGEEELLINRWRCGHRSWNIYDVYKGKPYYSEHVTTKPFDNLEDGSEFDFKNKTITQYWSSGCDNFTKLVYRRHERKVNSSAIKREYAKEIFDDFYSSIKLDSLFSCTDGVMSVYVNKKDSLIFVDTYKIY